MPDVRRRPRYVEPWKENLMLARFVRVGPAMVATVGLALRSLRSRPE